jgi:hypothetical protein
LGDEGPLLPEPGPDLPPQRDGEAVVEDYAATGLTLRVPAAVGDAALLEGADHLRRRVAPLALVPPGSAAGVRAIPTGRA